MQLSRYFISDNESYVIAPLYLALIASISDCTLRWHSGLRASSYMQKDMVDEDVSNPAA